MSKDTIFCAYNCSTSSPCSDWAKTNFTNSPTIITKSSGSSSEQKREGLKVVSNPHQWLGNGRNAVVTFSAGWGFIDSLIRSPSTMKMIDAVIVLDGIHCDPKTLDPWIEFASKAALGGDSPMLMMLHSNITPPYTSTKTTNRIIFDEGVSRCEAPGDPVTHPELVDAQLDGPVTINSTYGPRTWKKDPLLCWQGAGNLYRFEYEGNDAPTHIYIAQVVQPRAWKVLAKRWNGDCDCGDWFGEGRED